MDLTENEKQKLRERKKISERTKKIINDLLKNKAELTDRLEKQFKKFVAATTNALKEHEFFQFILDELKHFEIENEVKLGMEDIKEYMRIRDKDGNSKISLEELQVIYKEILHNILDVYD